MERSSLEWADAPGSPVLRMPEGELRGGLVMLHGASDGRARQPLFDQVAEVLTPIGVAVLSYERRLGRVSNVERASGLMLGT